MSTIIQQPPVHTAVSDQVSLVTPSAAAAPQTAVSVMGPCRPAAVPVMGRDRGTADPVMGRDRGTADPVMGRDRGTAVSVTAPRR